MITYVGPDVTLDDFSSEMREICDFDPEQEFTMKWIDEEGLFSSFMSLVISPRLRFKPIHHSP